MGEEASPNLYHALIAFAVALGVAAFMYAASSSDRARYSSPEYWHYKHHWGVSTPDKCDDSCRFVKKSKNEED